jgi:hypothetical protein
MRNFLCGCGQCSHAFTHFGCALERDACITYTRTSGSSRVFLFFFLRCRSQGDSMWRETSRYNDPNLKTLYEPAAMLHTDTGWSLLCNVQTTLWRAKYKIALPLLVAGSYFDGPHRKGHFSVQMLHPRVFNISISVSSYVLFTQVSPRPCLSSEAHNGFQLNLVRGSVLKVAERV